MPAEVTEAKEPRARKKNCEGNGSRMPAIEALAKNKASIECCTPLTAAIDDAGDTRSWSSCDTDKSKPHRPNREAPTPLVSRATGNKGAQVRTHGDDPMTAGTSMDHCIQMKGVAALSAPIRRTKIGASRVAASPNSSLAPRQTAMRPADTPRVLIYAIIICPKLSTVMCSIDRAKVEGQIACAKYMRHCPRQLDCRAPPLAELPAVSMASKRFRHQGSR
eukprot:gnl/TRDRNA2_/TRDRNA2_124105_c0_seq1.p2 gnl/TRDRNA2_/TRDRNA2_124105_c0~~gnl/TRDRNA2_/TRDRNA2_124105_c0_seq1.p2  ORF type:complete len:220 (-),score=29.76 gnl/TRDRNA2_/TRDRNA2_124105_c0_seq1:4-663(-)